MTQILKKIRKYGILTLTLQDSVKRVQEQVALYQERLRIVEQKVEAHHERLRDLENRR